MALHSPQLPRAGIALARAHPCIHARIRARQITALAGGTHCASYELWATTLDADAPCAEPLHSPMTSGADSNVVALDKIHLGSCQAHGWQDWKVDLSQEQMRDNLIFTLKTTLTTALDAISISLFVDEIPPNRASEIVARRSFDGENSLSLSSYDFAPLASVNRTLHIGVLCGPKDTRCARQ